MGETELINEVLEQQHVIPVVSGSINDAVHKVIDPEVVAVYVCLAGTDIDVLELVLNLRDVDQEVPIFVVGDPRGGQSLEEKIEQPDVHYLEADRARLEQTLDCLFR